MPTSAICRSGLDGLCGPEIRSEGFRSRMSRAGVASRDCGAPACTPAPADRRDAGARGGIGRASGRLSSNHAPRPSRATAVPGRSATLAATRGFTLLELIVVLLLLGLVTALAMPNLERLAAGVATRTQRDRILDQFAGLGRQAMLQRRNYVVFGTGAGQDTEPPAPGWETADTARGEPGRGAAGPSSDPFFHADHERYAIDLPKGWEIGLDPPLVVRANGACLGARLTLRHRGAVDVEVDLEPPYCRIDAEA